MNHRDVAELNLDSAAYWEAAAEGRLMLKRCSECGRAHHYPRRLCPFCHSDRTEWVEASGRGTVYSFSITLKPERRVLAYVTLAEGPTMMTNLTGDTPPAIGQDVAVEFTQTAEGLSLPVFRAV